MSTVCELEHDHRNGGFTQLENGGSFHSYLYVYQRVMKPLIGIDRILIGIYPRDIIDIPLISH